MNTSLVNKIIYSLHANIFFAQFRTRTFFVIAYKRPRLPAVFREAASTTFTLRGGRPKKRPQKKKNLKQCRL